MPLKIRQLKSRLQKAGFTIRSGKGSHTVWHHPYLPEVTITISGNEGKDAKPYQLKDARNALRQLGEDL